MVSEWGGGGVGSGHLQMTGWGWGVDRGMGRGPAVWHGRQAATQTDGEATLALCKCMFLVSCSSSMFWSFLFISRRFSSPGFTRSLRTLPSPLRSVWPAATDTSARAQAENHPPRQSQRRDERDRAENRETEKGAKSSGEKLSEIEGRGLAL